MSQTSELLTPSIASTAPATRAWLAVASLGAGLLHLATGAGAPLPALVALVIFGVAEVAWSMACLARDRAPWARYAVYAALVPVGCWAATATAGATFGVSPAFAALPAFPLLLASALDLSVAMTLAVGMRRLRAAYAAGGAGRARADRARVGTARAGTAPAGTAPAGTAPAGTARFAATRFVSALLLSAAAVTLVTVPALGATGAGAQAVNVHLLHEGGHHH